jgi:hypothetical protein
MTALFPLNILTRSLTTLILTDDHHNFHLHAILLLILSFPPFTIIIPLLSSNSESINSLPFVPIYSYFQCLHCNRS